jgi:hypothetical protein
MDVPIMLASTTLPIGVERCTFSFMAGFLGRGRRASWPATKQVHAKGKVLVTLRVTKLRHAERDEYFLYAVELFRHGQRVLSVAQRHPRLFYQKPRMFREHLP